MRRGLVILAWALAVGAATAEKVVVYRFDVSVEELRATADDLARQAVRELAAQSEVSSSLIERSVPSLGGERSAGLLAKELAEGVDAEVVILGSLVRPRPGGEVLFCCQAYHRADDVLWLFDPVQGQLRPGAPLAALQRAVTARVVEAYRTVTWPVAEVVAVRREAGRQLVRVRPAKPLPLGGDGYVVARLAAPIVDLDSSERFAAVPETLGLGRMVGAAGGGVELDLPLEPALTVGERVRLAPADTPWRADPGPTLVITSLPRGATVTVGGRTYGVTPARVPLPAEGDVELLVTHPERLPFQRVIGVADRLAGLVTVRLAEPSAAGPVRTPEDGVRIRIESRPTGAEVFVDGESRGLTPLDLEGLRGRPVIRVERPGYRPWEAQVAASGPLALRAELESLFGGLSVIAEQAGLKVLLDDREQGLTPLQLTNVPVGPHRVSVMGEGVEVRTSEVVVRPGEVSVVRFGDAPTLVTGEGAPPQAPSAESAPWRPGELLWERKVTLTGPAGPHRMHLAVARTEAGLLVSVTVGPPSPFRTAAAEDGLSVVYSQLAADSPRSWTPEGAGLLERLDLAPVGGDAPGLEVRLKTAPGVTARVHESSTLERIRVVLTPPGRG